MTRTADDHLRRIAGCASRMAAGLIAAIVLCLVLIKQNDMVATPCVCSVVGARAMTSRVSGILVTAPDNGPSRVAEGDTVFRIYNRDDTLLLADSRTALARLHRERRRVEGALAVAVATQSWRVKMAIAERGKAEHEFRRHVEGWAVDNSVPLTAGDSIGLSALPTRVTQSAEFKAFFWEWRGASDKVRLADADTSTVADLREQVRSLVDELGEAESRTNMLADFKAGAVIVAPGDGFVLAGSQDAILGKAVGAGSRLGVFAHELHWCFIGSVAGRDAARISVGDSAHIELPTGRILSAWLPGAVTEISGVPALAEDDRQMLSREPEYRVVVRCDSVLTRAQREVLARIRYGMRARVKIVIGTRPLWRALLAPSSS